MLDSRVVPHAAHITRILRYFTARLLISCSLLEDNLHVYAGVVFVCLGPISVGSRAGNCHDTYVS